MTGQSPLVLEA